VEEGDSRYMAARTLAMSNTPWKGRPDSREDILVTEGDKLAAKHTPVTVHKEVCVGASAPNMPPDADTQLVANGSR
jgi:hypothetical protein